MASHDDPKGVLFVPGLTGRSASPSGLAQPNVLLARAHRRARMAAILRDQRLQVSPTSPQQ